MHKSFVFESSTWWLNHKIAVSNRSTAKSMKRSWRATTPQWRAPNLASPRLFRSPTRRSVPLPRSDSPTSRIPTTRTPGASGTRQTFRRWWLPLTSTSFPSQTPNRKKLSPTCPQKALKGTETQILTKAPQTRSEPWHASSMSLSHLNMQLMLILIPNKCFI